GPASATEFRKGQPTETINRDEVIHSDLFITGDRVRVDGTVEGDVFIFGQNAEVDGHIKGDVIVFAHTVRITGQVDGNVRAFDNSLTITGTVDKNVMTFADSFELDAAGKVGGSVTGFLNSPSLDGTIGRDVLLMDHSTSINGVIKGSVDARGENFTIGPKAEVAGHIKYTGTKEADVSSQAKLASPVEFKKQEHETQNTASHYLWQGIWAAALILFGLVVFLLLPDFSRESVANTERYGASFGLGILVLFGVPIAAIIACITVVGLFIGLATLFIWYAALYVAMIVVGGLVGQWLMGRTTELWPLIGRMIVGLLLVRLCFIIPEAGPWIKYLVVVPWGLGAISLSIYRRFAPIVAPPSASAPAPYAPPPLPPNTTVGGIQPA
ncbi:MAG: polymer-forming cytoskeletal protein, partial [Candidatus Acidiferrum sp.]